MSEARNGFSRLQRVRKRSQFLRIQSEGKKVYSRHFLLSTLSGQSAETRIGITISKKVDKRAARRNRLRRRVRELFRTHAALLTQSKDLVVIARRGSTELPFQTVQEELTVLFKRARLCKNRC